MGGNMTMAKELDVELAVYQRNLKEWENREGEYVLIKGEEMCGFFSSYDDALKTGYEKFGLESFLVKQINVIEQAHFISRSIDPCRILLSQ